MRDHNTSAVSPGNSSCSTAASSYLPRQWRPTDSAVRCDNLLQRNIAPAYSCDAAIAQAVIPLSKVGATVGFSKKKSDNAKLN